MKNKILEAFLAFIIITLSFIFFYAVLSNTLNETDLLELFKKGLLLKGNR